MPALLLGGAAHIDGVAGDVKGAVDPLHPVDRANVDPLALRPLVLKKLGPAEELEKLDDMRRPAGHVARQFLQHRRRRLALPVVDRVRHIGARADRERRQQAGAGEVGNHGLGGIRLGDPPGIVKRAIAYEVADIGNHPVLTGLDEQVLVEPRDVGVDHRTLGGQDRQQRLQLVTPRGVALAINRREKRVQIVAAVAHGILSPARLSRCRLPGSRSSSARPKGHCPACWGPGGRRRSAGNPAPRRRSRRDCGSRLAHRDRHSGRGFRAVSLA